MRDTKLKVIGAQRSKGNYQGHDYDNVIFFVSRDCYAENPEEAAGIMQCDRVKLPWKIVQAPLQNYIGLSCNVFYDRYGRAVDIEFINDDELIDFGEGDTVVL